MEKSQILVGKISIGLQLGRASLETRNLSLGCLRFFRLALLPVLDPLHGRSINLASVSTIFQLNFKLFQQCGIFLFLFYILLRLWRDNQLIIQKMNLYWYCDYIYFLGTNRVNTYVYKDNYNLQINNNQFYLIFHNNSDWILFLSCLLWKRDTYIVFPVKSSTALTISSICDQICFFITRLTIFSPHCRYMSATARHAPPDLDLIFMINWWLIFSFWNKGNLYRAIQPRFTGFGLHILIYPYVTLI